MEPTLLRQTPHSRFQVGDYMAYDGGSFNVILSDSVLQNIDVTDADLFSKIARDLVPGGSLMITMPYSCAYNHALWMGAQSQGASATRTLSRLR